MGTPRVPELKPESGKTGEEYVEFPRTGPLMWVLLAAFLIPPALVAYLGNYVVYIPHQTLWVILLGCPFPLILLTLPRKYILNPEQIQIAGWFYRLRIPASEIVSIEPISTGRAIFHPGSMYCADPQRAWKLTRKKGRALVFSPNQPERFRALVKGDQS